jgi:hypothetical protein
MLVNAQDKLNWIFQQSDWFQAGVFTVHGLIVLGISYGFLLIFNRRSDTISWTPVGPYFASLSVVFSLFLAFHANNVWTHKNQAERSFIEAGTSIKRMDELLSPGELNLPEARLQLQRYVKYVFKDEWRKHRNRRPSERADSALRELQVQVVKAIPGLAPPSASQLNLLLNEVSRTRSDRLWIGSNYTEAISWFAVLALGLLTHLAIASIHFDKPRAGLIALILLSLATTTSYWSLGIVIDPYRETEQLNPINWLKLDLVADGGAL